MRKKTAVELGIIAVTAVALVFATASLFPRKDHGTRPVVSLPGAAQGAVRTLSKTVDLFSPGIKISPMKDDNFYVKFCRITDALPLERDPFSFAWNEPRTSRDGLDLTGILWDAQKPAAVINGVFYGVGDSTDQFTVSGIREDKVLLKDRKGDFELRLKS